MPLDYNHQWGVHKLKAKWYDGIPEKVSAKALDNSERLYN